MMDRAKGQTFYVDFTRSLDRSQDSLLRPNGWELKNGTAVEHAASYGYDVSGRLKNVHASYPLAGTPDFTYAYEPNSHGLVKSVTRTGGHTVANTYAP